MDREGCVEQLVSVLNRITESSAKRYRQSVQSCCKRILCQQKQFFGLESKAAAEKMWDEICSIEKVSAPFFARNLDYWAGKMVLGKYKDVSVRLGMIGEGLLQHIEAELENTEQPGLPRQVGGSRPVLKGQARPKKHRLAETKTYKKLVGFAASAEEESWENERIDELLYSLA